MLISISTIHILSYSFSIHWFWQFKKKDLSTLISFLPFVFDKDWFFVNIDIKKKSTANFHPNFSSLNICFDMIKNFVEKPILESYITWAFCICSFLFNYKANIATNLCCSNQILFFISIHLYFLCSCPFYCFLQTSD